MDKQIYEHTGWTQHEGYLCYLTAAGAIGLPLNRQGQVQVVLKQDNYGIPITSHPLYRYRLPLQPQDLAFACQSSLALWDVTGNPAETIPLWAAAYLAPLSPFLAPDFALWVHGKSGSFKSALAALALAHFGDWGGRYGMYYLPLSFNGNFAGIVMDTITVRDALVVADDYAPGSDNPDKDDILNYLLRLSGNFILPVRDIQALMNCMILITSEVPPPGRGQVVAVPIAHTPFNSPEYDWMSARLTRAQGDAYYYPTAMGGYIRWINLHWHALKAQLPERAAKYARLIGHRFQADDAQAHGKLAAAINTALRYMTDEGAIDDHARRERQNTALDALASGL